MSNNPVNYLRLLPSIDEILNHSKINTLLTNLPREMLTNIIRTIVENYRFSIIEGEECPESKEEIKNKIIPQVLSKVQKHLTPELRRVINATGVILHTNLGRAMLSENSIQAVNAAATGYSNLELNLETGKRGSRYAPLEGVIRELTGAESVLVVNNNASAVLLALNTLAAGKEVIVSRGQLIEIGGSFRIPDVMSQSGASLVEVGTTNKTYPADYKAAITENTGVLLNVHTSNYRITGFTRETTIKELSDIGGETGIPVMSDLGSGSLVDMSRFGLPYEPTVGEIISEGADIVTFSGDKLLGGPQAGIIAGNKEIIEKMKRNPLTRAIRIDKFTVAALEATFREYLDYNSAIYNIPVLKMLSASNSELYSKALKLMKKIEQENWNDNEFEIVETISRVGGGAMPDADLPSLGIEITPQNLSPDELASKLRREHPAVIGKIQNEKMILDMRTVQEKEIEELFYALKKSLTN